MTTQAKAAVASGGQRQGLRGASNLSRAHCTPGGSNGQVYAQGRIVGQVRGSIFYKSVCGNAHMLRKPPAWALDTGSLLEAEKLGATAVEIHDSESGCTYTASLEQIRRYGFTFDRGFGRQIALPLGHWRVWRPGQAREEQLPLFGVAP